MADDSDQYRRYKSCLPAGPTRFWSCRPDSKVAGLGPTGRRKNGTLFRDLTHIASLGDRVNSQQLRHLALMGKLWVICHEDCGENRPVFWQLLLHISSMKTPRLRCSCTLLNPTTWGPGLKSMASMTRILHLSASKSKAPQKMGRWDGGNYRHVKMVMFALATSLCKWFTGLQPS